jgi:hypothetical protein
MGTPGVRRCRRRGALSSAAFSATSQESVSRAQEQRAEWRLREAEPEALLLVVEDEPNILELLSASLRLAGFEVATATGGLEALTAAQRHRPDPELVALLRQDAGSYTPGWRPRWGRTRPRARSWPPGSRSWPSAGQRQRRGQADQRLGAADFTATSVGGATVYDLTGTSAAASGPVI